jgi:hypothetical protein
MRPQGRRALIEGTLVESPADTQRAVAEARQASGAAAGDARQPAGAARARG